MNFSAWLPIFLLAVAFSAILLVHLSRNDVPYMSKWAWAALIVLTMPLGGVVYLLVVVLGAGIQREDAEGRRP